MRASKFCLPFVLLLPALLGPVAFAQSAAPSKGAVRSVDGRSAKPMSDAEKAEMAERVRAETLHAWSGYKKYAWGHDALKPLSQKPFDWYGDGHSLLMTPVDALDTLTLMGLKPQADEARTLIDTKLNLDQDIYVKDFEITIRLLGSLISCYEMTGDKRLLELADDLGRRMSPMFDSPTGMPYEYVNLRTGAVRGTKSNPAEIGTLLLEYGMLARLTGKQNYYDMAKRALVELYKRRSAIGLVGSEIDVETGKWTDPTAGIMGGIDSYYEYLLKASILFGDKDCARMWLESVAAIDKYLADERADWPLVWAGGYEHRAAHAYVLRRARCVLSRGAGAGRTTSIGRRNCRIPATGCGTWRALSRRRWTTRRCRLRAPNYELRPEIIESTYYLYHYTHDAKYLAMGRTYFDGLVKYCRTDEAYAALADVRSKQKKDAMESFFFAETLKYLYLLFAPESTLEFDSVIFNTEAHPMKRSLGLK